MVYRCLGCFDFAALGFREMEEQLEPGFGAEMGSTPASIVSPVHP